MSADNWTHCPKCSDERAAEEVKREAVVAAQYGQIPVEEFDAMRAELTAFLSEKKEPTFREDYEFYGAEDGTVQWHYSGACTGCGLRVKFEGSHPFYPESGA